MKIFLDDIRPAPIGWVRAYWPNQVIDMLSKNYVEEISLDHDLGDDKRGTGYDVLVWIENAISRGEIFLPKISIHSANVAARVRMENAVKKIEYMSNQIDVLELNKLFSKLEEISKDGYSVIIKIDSERWADFPPAPYTTIMFSPSGNNFKMDSSNVIEGIKSCIDYYENNI